MDLEIKGCILSDTQIFWIEIMIVFLNLPRHVSIKSIENFLGIERIPFMIDEIVVCKSELKIVVVSKSIFRGDHHLFEEFLL